MNAIAPADKSRGWKNVLKIIGSYIVFAGIFQAIGLLLAGVDIRHYKGGAITAQQLFIISLFGVAGATLLIWLFRKYVDRRSFRSLGFQRSYVGKDISLGIIYGFVFMFLGFILLLLTNQISISSVHFQAADILLSIGTFSFIAITEELLIRGYVLTNLLTSFNQAVALIISSAIFTLMHVLNPSFSLLGMVDLFVGGILFGLAYIYTGNLWFPIAFHFSWNFFQGTVFGFNVSGLDTYSLIETSYRAPNAWNGGAFGYEGSLLSIIFELLAMAILVIMFKDRLRRAPPGEWSTSKPGP
jgi:membrane protease YdiL (CAAX protease family)